LSSFRSRVLRRILFESKTERERERGREREREEGGRGDNKKMEEIA
jgi:hypothetical protein